MATLGHGHDSSPLVPGRDKMEEALNHDWNRRWTQARSEYLEVMAPHTQARPGLSRLWCMVHGHRQLQAAGPGLDV